MVTKLKYDNTNTFLLRGNRGSLLIDTGYAGTLPAFYRTIKAHNIKIRDIDYILATHYHPDHIGLVSELIKQEVRLVTMDTQQSHMHFADAIFSREKGLYYEPIPAEKAILLRREESRAFLKTLGIDGEIISTPSHSEDSISLILDSGECFVGDLEPMDYLAGYEQNDALKRDWERILSYAPKTLFYAHANQKSL